MQEVRICFAKWVKLFQEDQKRQSPENGALKYSKWRRDRDSNPGRALTLAGFQDRCIQPLCHPSTAGNTTRNWFAVNGIMTHQVTFSRIGCFDCPRLTSMIQDMKGSSALQLLEP